MAVIIDGGGWSDSDYDYTSGSSSSRRKSEPTHYLTCDEILERIELDITEGYIISGNTFEMCKASEVKHIEIKTGASSGRGYLEVYFYIFDSRYTAVKMEICKSSNEKFMLSDNDKIKILKYVTGLIKNRTKRLSVS